jgi:TPR repeat protein
MKTVKELLTLARQEMYPFADYKKHGFVLANEKSHAYVLEAIKIADLNSPQDMAELWTCIDTAGADLFDYKDKHRRAKLYLITLANLGNLFAIETLMLQYLHGMNGVEKDESQFKYWANIAIECGSESAKNELRKFVPV